ncbi:DUF1345 domain-containing protein [Zoogloea sp.]|uniref:DUF1345 domain-containing protein n=1 Tax=Zoogloea sp. TaxID=49181 RepID=UPI001415D302|nr:MAG: DUF1345 domain-containing protein [Zoogloea sp.]
MPAPHAHPNLLVRQLQARPRLFLSITLGVLIYLLLPGETVHRETTRLLLSWNGGVGLYLALAAVMVARATPEQMHSRARLQAEGRVMELSLVILATIACLAAIFAELVVVKDLTGFPRTGHVLLTVLTVSLSWAFIHLMFALHYAHDFYRALGHSGSGGLQFPGEDIPDYGDFLYFAAVIGTSGQTADVSFVSRPMRRLGLLHCVIAYAFNATLLALTVNIASGLI